MTNISVFLIALPLTPKGISFYCFTQHPFYDKLKRQIVMNLFFRYKWLFFSISVSVIIHCIAVLAFIRSDVLKIRFGLDNSIIAKIVQNKNIESPKKTGKVSPQSPDEPREPISDEKSEPQAPTTTEDYPDGTSVSTERQEITNPEEQRIRLEVPRLSEGIGIGGQGYKLNIDTEISPQKKTIDRGIALLRYNREELHYNIYWVGIHVGSARLSAKRHLTDVVIQSEVHSNKFISNFYRVEDYAKSTITNGKPHRFRIKQIEGKYRSDKETFFDYSEGLIRFIDYLKNIQTEHTIKEGIYWDVISGFYYLRSMPVFDTNRIFVDVFDSNKFIKVQVVILGRERIETASGEDLEAIKTKIIIHSEGLFKKVGDIFVWLSDNADRIPLKVETKVPVGKVTAELSKIETD
ncbi:MAG: DUF3108 domain-containing protein [Thermodesulfovibrionales bacterium]